MKKIKNYLVKASLCLMVVIFLSSISQAESVGRTVGLTIDQSNAPRANALGDAFSAVTGDIAALNFNPASLAGLLGTQLSLQRKQGAFDENYSQVAVGSEFFGGVFGATANLYDSGSATLWDGYNPPKTVTAQKDLLVNFGYGRTIGIFDIGANLRYLSTELAEEKKAVGETVELGVNLPLYQKFRLSAVGTIFANDLTYYEQSEKLPKIYRVGGSYESILTMGSYQVPFLCLVDVKYSETEDRLSESIGLESRVIDSLALRLGYKFNQGLQGFTVGFGFFVREFSFDYSFGLISENELDPLQAFGLSMRFGNKD
ncbi:MAG: hypothetical protein GF384_02085 [Elusimicrobia bacterium]|nr:hypothetical protein [Elusimicrobiota bacterium]